MKKLVWMFAAVAAISFASCGGNKSNEATVEEETIPVEIVEEEVVLSADSIEVVEVEVIEE